MMNDACALVSYLSPVIAPGRQRPLACAIYRTGERMRDHGTDDIHFTKEIYPHVADLLHRSNSTVERAIFRAVEDCWMDGGNAKLDGIIGRKLPLKPRPSVLILYCAFFLVFERPYHNAKDAPGFPLLF